MILTLQSTNNLSALVSPLAQVSLTSPWMNFLQNSMGRNANRHQVMVVMVHGRIIVVETAATCRFVVVVDDC